MIEALTEFIASLQIGEAQTYRNLTIFPLAGLTYPHDDYLLLDEALDLGTVEITEKTPEGTVPEVLVINRSDKPVLMLDGEELIGARQNRVLNCSSLIPPRSESTVGVSCVEAGRWGGTHGRFTVSGIEYNAGGRRRKTEEIALAVAEDREPLPNQSRIWTDVDMLLTGAGATSPTAAMTEAYAAREEELRDYTIHFRAVDGQTGAAFAIDGELVGLDAFGRPGTLDRLFSRLVSSYAIDAVLSGGEVCAVDKSDVEDLIRAAGAGRYEVFPSHGLGKQVCVTSRRTVGLALMVDLSVLHLSVFARPDLKCRKCGTRMSQPSLRKRARQQRGEFGDALQ